MHAPTLSYAEALAAAACLVGRRPTIAAKGRQVGQKLVVKAVNDEQRIAYTEVYAPNEIDAHGAFMLPADVEMICHRYMELCVLKSRDGRMDVQHDGYAGAGFPVECWVNHGDPRFTEGAWCMGVKVTKQAAWDDIKAGRMETLSFKAAVYSETVEVECEGDTIIRVIGPALQEAA